MNWFKKTPKNWYEAYQPSKWERFKDTLALWFQNCLCWITEHKSMYWVDALIDTLCYLEMNLKLAKDPELRDSLYSGDVSVGPEHKSWCQTQIPENTLYCEGCPFQGRSSIARFFYGSQMSGFCYYLNQGDFTFGHPTDILWDGCKCCGVGEDLDWDDMEVVETKLDPNDYSEYTK